MPHRGYSLLQRFLHNNNAEVCARVCVSDKSFRALSERLNVRSGAASLIRGKQFREIHAPRPPVLI